MCTSQCFRWPNSPERLADTVQDTIACETACAGLGMCFRSVPSRPPPIDAGSRRHNVGEVDFGFIIPVAEPVADEDAEATSPVETSPPAPTPVPAPPTRPTPNTSAKRRHLARDAPPAISPPPQPTPAPPAEEPAPAEDEDQPMEDAPPLTDQQPPPARQRGPLSSIISATKRLSLDRSSPPPPAPLAAQEEVGESPADAPGSGRPSAATPVVESSVLLQKVLDDLDDSTQQALPDNSSPIERRVATRRAARMSAESGGSARSAGAAGPGPARRTSPRFSRGSVAESHASREVSHSEVAEEVVQEDVVEVQEVQEVQHEEEEVEEEAGEEAGEAEGGAEDSTAAPDGDAEDGDEASVENEQEQEQEQEQDQEQEQEQEQARDGAEEAGEEETVQRLGRKRTRRTRPAPSPELSSGLVEESPPPKRRRRRESVSPAQQQRQQQPEQPAKKARVGRPPSKTQPQPQPRPSPPPQPQSQSRARPKPKAKRQTRKKRKAPVEDKADEEEESGSVPVTVQRFTKPPRAGDSADGGEEDPVAGVLNGEIPFANRGGVNAVDVLSKLCEELIETYMGKLEERLQAAEDPATKREQRTMYRALEAFQEELRTRLLEHVSAWARPLPCPRWLDRTKKKKKERKKQKKTDAFFAFAAA